MKILRFIKSAYHEWAEEINLVVIGVVVSVFAVGFILFLVWLSENYENPKESCQSHCDYLRFEYIDGVCCCKIDSQTWSCEPREPAKELDE
jgi:hypothetical protein